MAFLASERAEALRWAEAALVIADGRRLGSVFVDALVTKALVLAESGRPSESTALLRHAVQTAIDQDLPTQAVRGYFNLADNLLAEARFSEAEELLDQGPRSGPAPRRPPGRTRAPRSGPDGSAITGTLG